MSLVLKSDEIRAVDFGTSKVTAENGLIQTELREVKIAFVVGVPEPAVAATGVAKSAPAGEAPTVLVMDQVSSPGKISITAKNGGSKSSSPKSGKAGEEEDEGVAVTWIAFGK